MTTEMTELQQARAKWLDAETRALKAERRCTELQARLFHLTGDLIASKINAAVESMASVQRGFFTALDANMCGPSIDQITHSRAMARYREALEKVSSKKEI